jgi:hypothetical protein
MLLLFLNSFFDVIDRQRSKTVQQQKQLPVIQRPIVPEVTGRCSVMYMFIGIYQRISYKLIKHDNARCFQ